MKDTISLFSIKKAARNDLHKLSSLNFMLCTATVMTPVLPLLRYVILDESAPLYVIAMVLVGFILSATFQGKALLDIVHNRQQNPFAHHLSLLQAFFVQAATLGLWCGFGLLAFNNIYYIFHIFLPFHAPHGTENQILLFLFLALLYLIMRLQFATLYILENQCTILQGVRSSWLLTRHNNWLVERFFLWQVAAVIISILIFSSDWSINFLIMSVTMIVVLATPMKVRMFKELE